jgi:hypothetical protein
MRLASIVALTILIVATFDWYAYNARHLTAVKEIVRHAWVNF